MSTKGDFPLRTSVFTGGRRKRLNSSLFSETDLKTPLVEYYFNRDYNINVIPVGWDSTNVITTNDELSTTSYNRSNISITGGHVDYEGGFTAKLVTETAVTDFHQFNTKSSVTTKPASSQTIRFSTKLKPYNQNYVGLAVYDNTFANAYRIVFDVSSGTITSNESYGTTITAYSSPEIRSVGNGFYEVSICVVINNTETYYQAQVAPLKASTGFTTNSAGDTTKGFYIVDTAVYAASTTSVTLSGSSVTLTYTPVSGGYSLSVDTAAITTTGSSVNAKTQRNTPVTSGVVTLTGSSVAVRKLSKVPVSTSTITVTGSTVSAKRSYTLGVSTSAVTITGSSVSLKQTKTLGVTSGSISLTGSSISVKKTSNVNITSSEIVLTGSNINLSRTKSLSVGTAEVILTGSSIALAKTRVLAVTSSAVNLTGSQVRFQLNVLSSHDTGGRFRRTNKPTISWGFW